MNVLKWFKQNLCSYDEFTEFTGKTPEEKIISGEELFHQMYRLARMEALEYLRNNTKYIWYGRENKYVNKLIDTYGIMQIYSNRYYKIRLKAGLNIEEYGLKAVHFEPAYPAKKEKKHREYYKYHNDKVTTNLDEVYRYLTKKEMNHNEFIRFIKTINSMDLKREYNYFYQSPEVTIPGKFFIRGKEFSEIKLIIPMDYEVRNWRRIKSFEISRSVTCPYAENIYKLKYKYFDGLEILNSDKRPFEMGRDKWMLSSENCWA